MTKMTSIDDTAFARLEQEGRLLNAVLKAPTERPGRFGFRGELAIKFAQQFADEKRPPELSADQLSELLHSHNYTVAPMRRRVNMRIANWLYASRSMICSAKRRRFSLAVDSGI